MRARLMLPLLVLASCGVDLPVDDAASREDAIRNCSLVTCPTPPGPGPGPVEPDYCVNLAGTLTVARPVVPLGESTNVSWRVTVPSRCKAEVRLNGAVVSTSGSFVVTPAGITTIVLQGNGVELARATASAEVPSRWYVTDGSAQSLRYFAAAIAKPNTTVVLSHDVELDLTNAALPLPIAAGVTIVSEAPATTSGGAGDPLTRPLRPMARTASTLGPRIFTTLNAGLALFAIMGDGVTMRGFRLEGPSQSVAVHDVGGVLVWSGARHAEFDTLEISGFPRAGIDLRGIPDASVPAAFSDFSVHDSFIHHNQCNDGFGYGVVIGQGAKAEIFRNVFDWNRHAVSADGAEYTGYRATENLVLRDGERCDLDGTDCRPQQQFDVHGSEHCSGPRSYDCGDAGDAFVVSDNAFQHQGAYSFLIRGTPRTEAVVVNNVFAQPDVDSAIGHTEVAPTGEWQNVFGKQTFGQYGVCDFDGDGRDDLFLATGRTWWFASGGRLQWSYLAARTDDLDTLGFGDFNHDGRCDVLRVTASGWQLSSGGRAAWAPIPNAPNAPLDTLRFRDFDGDGFTDIFHRAANGDWLVFQGTNAAQPRLLGSSTRPLDELLFGDFDGDRITDVMSVGPNGWQLSKSGTGTWSPWAARFDSFAGLIVGDFDGQPGDDVLRVAPAGATGPTGVPQRLAFTFSANGQAGWSSLGMDYANPPTALPRLFTGRFGTTPRAVVLALNPVNRFTSALAAGQQVWLNHSMYTR